jgi:Tol biopolymer transport system component
VNKDQSAKFHPGGFAAFESSDGAFLYYVKADQPGIWRMPARGGDETRVLSRPSPENWGDWALFDHGIYYLDESDSKPAIRYFTFTTRKSRKIANLESLPPEGDPGFAVSPDQKRIVFSRVDISSVDLMLVENFRN